MSSRNKTHYNGETMFRFYRRKLIIPAAMTVALSGAFAIGCGGANEQGNEEDELARHVTARVEVALDDLDATEQQREQIHAIKDELLEKFKQNRKAHEQRHAELLEQWKSEQPDAERVHELVDEGAAQRLKMAHEVTDAVLRLHAVLTAEQRLELVDKMEKLKARRPWRRHGFGGE